MSVFRTALCTSLFACSSVVVSACVSAAPDDTHAVDRYADLPPVPKSPADLLRNIKFAFDRNAFLDDASYERDYVQRLFGGEVASFGSNAFYPRSGGMSSGSGTCSDGGLCARDLRFSKGVKRDGTEYAQVVVRMDTGNGIDANRVRDILGNEGAVKISLPSAHRIYRPTTAKGGNEEREYVFGDGRSFLVDYGPDATVELFSFSQDQLPPR